MSIDKNTLTQIKELTPRQLKEYQKIVKFFALLGVNEQELINLIDLAKHYPEFVKKVNQVLTDQKYINDQIVELMREIRKEKAPIMKSIHEFNKKGAVLNPYPYDEN